MACPPPYRLDVDEVWAAIDEERRSLCTLLEDLAADEWAHPSLCAGWQVRDVAAHLALAQTGAARAAVEFVRAGGSFDRMVAGTARRHADVPTAELIAEIREMIGSRRTAPAVSHLEPLLDLLVHGQDIAVPLGRERAMPVHAAATAATRAWTLPWPVSIAFRTRSRMRGLQLTATDTDWAAGTGARVEGPIEALLLLLTGRTTAALPRLSGDGVRRLDQAGTRNDSSR
jgi:uncharacterized protein (TIGR03083 family)